MQSNLVASAISPNRREKTIRPDYRILAYEGDPTALT